VDLTLPFDRFLESRPTELKRNLRLSRVKSPSLGAVELGVS